MTSQIVYRQFHYKKNQENDSKIKNLYNILISFVLCKGYLSNEMTALRAAKPPSNDRSVAFPK